MGSFRLEAHCCREDKLKTKYIKKQEHVNRELVGILQEQKTRFIAGSAKRQSLESAPA